MNETSRRDLLPAGFDKPRWLFWLFVLPQLVLLAIQFYQWELVSGEMSPAQQGKAITLASLGCLLILSQVGLWCFLVKLQRRIPLAACIAYLVAHIAYLWLVFVWMQAILPDSVRSWILPETEYLFYPFALVMPALVYCGIRIASVLLPVPRGVDVGGTVAGLLGVPLVWFLVLQAAIMVRMPSFVIAVLFVGSTTLVLLLFVRFIMHVHNALSKRRIQAWILPLLAGVVAPIAGLLLNRAIPFPYDFQSPYVYTFAILNGLLLIAAVIIPMKAVWSFVLLSITYSFSLYFFVVFLPFLPLSLLAMIAAGAGFLILAPTFLFLAHTRILISKGQALSRNGGRARTIGLFVMVAGLLPAGLLCMAFQDRVQLDRAMAYVWEPDDLQPQAGFRAGPVLRALQRVRARKAGVYYPFLSEIYNRIVFDGMTLPDRKLETLEALLGGTRESPSVQSRTFFLGFLDGRQRARSGRVRLPQRKVDLTDIAVAHDVTADGFVEAHVTLQLTNRGGFNSEFVTQLAVPEGVLITDYWLDVEGEKVPGRLFERKTALWVYHMIRDVVRQDPGLLYYESPTRLRLRVFPFATGQTRSTGWTVLFPANQRPEIQIGDQRVSLWESEDTPESTVLGLQGETGTALVWPNGVPAAWIPHQREAYAHLIVDQSLQGHSDLAGVAQTLTAKLAEITPHINAFALTVANFESRDVTHEPLPLDQLTHVLAAAQLLPPQGGFDPERVIRRHLRIMETSPDRFVHRLPVFIAVTPQHTNTVWMEESRLLDHVASDHPWFYLLDRGGLYRKGFNQTATELVTGIPSPDPIHLFRQGNLATTLPAGNAAAWRFLVGPQAPLERFNAENAAFEDVAVAWLEESTPYVDGLRLWTDWFAIFCDPAKEQGNRMDLIRQSREARVLFPLASFIVVENEAQWRMLERTEAATGSARRGLEHDEFIEARPPVSGCYCRLLGGS
jgi:hypothetical protein